MCTPWTPFLLPLLPAVRFCLEPLALTALIPSVYLPFILFTSYAPY